LKGAPLRRPDGFPEAPRVISSLPSGLNLRTVWSPASTQ